MDVDAFFSRLNPLIRGILNSRLHPLLSRGLMVLTVTGRRTGTRYSFPVGYQQESATRLVVMVSKAQRKRWWKNFRAPGPVEMRLRGRDRRGTARALDPASDAFRRHAEETVRRVPGMDRVFGIRYDRKIGLTDAQAEQLGREIAAVHIDLEPRAA